MLLINHLAMQKRLLNLNFTNTSTQKQYSLEGFHEQGQFRENFKLSQTILC